MKLPTYEEKKEARDFMSEVTGVNLDHCDPHEMDIEDIMEVRSTLIFKSWKLRKQFKKVLNEMRKSLL